MHRRLPHGMIGRLFTRAYIHAGQADGRRRIVVVSSIINSISNSFAPLICHGPHISPGSFTLKETRARKSIPIFPAVLPQQIRPLASMINSRMTVILIISNFKIDCVKFAVAAMQITSPHPSRWLTENGSS